MHSIIQCRDEYVSTYSRRGHNENASACRDGALYKRSTVCVCVRARRTIRSIENGRVLLAIIHTGPARAERLLLSSASDAHLRRWLETTGRCSVGDRCDAERRRPISAACVLPGCHSSATACRWTRHTLKMSRTWWHSSSVQQSFYLYVKTTECSAHSVSTSHVHTYTKHLLKLICILINISHYTYAFLFMMKVTQKYAVKKLWSANGLWYKQWCPHVTRCLSVYFEIECVTCVWYNMILVMLFIAVINCRKPVSVTNSNMHCC